ncbi:transketolase [Sediminimonas sp.]|uniref:transketolase n=1 Tax=Sediminimonas sp. TaxID=2823379 RepID=UPI0025FDAB44|nr:transketolase [Sediminimonas sp.]
MRHAPLAFATILACVTAPTLEARVALPGSGTSALTAPASQGAQIVNIKDNKSNGEARNEKRKNNERAGKDDKPYKHAKDKNKRDKIKAKVKRSKDDRVRDSDAILRERAPEGRDMSVLLGATPLAFLGPNTIFADVPEDRLLTYRNCPPGLAKKDPPCVPPGLAKKGVTYDEWVSYDHDRLDEIYLEQRLDYLGSDIVLDDDNLLLSSSQIASLYGLRPAPASRRYALIDGQPVLLTDEDNTSLLGIYDLGRVENLPSGLRIAPTAALTQNELRQTYSLPTAEPGYNYAVVNGELVTLQDSAFETLQLIRIVRATF